MFTRKSTMNQGSLLKSKLGAPGCEFGHTCHQVAMSKSNYDTHSRPCTDVQSGIILSCLEYPASSWLKSFTFYWVTLAIPGGLLPIPHQVLTMTHTEVFRLLDQDPFKKLAYVCKYGLLKQALYLKSKPEYCVFIIRSMSCVLTGRMPTCNWWRHILHTLSSVRMRKNLNGSWSSHLETSVVRVMEFSASITHACALRRIQIWPYAGNFGRGGWYMLG